MVLKLTEHDLQVHVFDVLRLNESLDPRLKWIYAVPNGNYRSWAIGANLKLEGVKKGISDICLPFPGSLIIEGIREYFPAAYIEMKSETGAATPKQKEFFAFIEDESNYATLLAFHFDPALDFIEEYCSLKLRGRERLPRKM